MIPMTLYPQILGIMDKINEWNEQLNTFAENHLDNVGVGMIIIVAVFVGSAWAIKILTK